MDILLIEDNCGDIALTREALRQAKVIHRLSIVIDGVQAVDFLLRENGYEEAIRPDLILLDLNLPRMSGREVLQAINSNPVLREIPLVVLTSSQSEQDVLIGRDPARSLYLVKPLDFSAMVDLMKTVQRFWAGTLGGRKTG